MNGKSPDTVRFSLCPECLTKYRALHFDQAAKLWLSVTEGSMYWKDEHPEGERPLPLTIFRHAGISVPHEQCVESIRRLMGARDMLWRQGTIPEQLQPLWAQAQQMLPDWPGFSRLTLNEYERSSLEGSEAEFEDITQYLAERSTQIVEKFQADGTTERVFTFKEPAQSSVESNQQPKKYWWQFW